MSEEGQSWLSRFELPQCLDRLLAERPAPAPEPASEEDYVTWVMEIEAERLGG